MTDQNNEVRPESILVLTWIDPKTLQLFHSTGRPNMDCLPVTRFVPAFHYKEMAEAFPQAVIVGNDGFPRIDLSLILS